MAATSETATISGDPYILDDDVPYDPTQGLPFFDSRFPDYVGLLNTPAYGLHCLLYAIVLSLAYQHPTLPKTDGWELLAYLRSANPTANIDNLQDDEGSLALQLWGKTHGLELQLGFVGERNSVPILLARDNGETAPGGETLIVWVHNDHAAPSAAAIDEEALSHWSGMTPYPPNVSGVEQEAAQIDSGEEIFDWDFIT